MKKKIWLLSAALLLTCVGWAAKSYLSQNSQPTITPKIVEAATQPPAPSKRESGKVFMIKEISPSALVKIYQALGEEAQGRVAIKMHMGEAGNKNYLSAELVRELAVLTKGSFVDSNTYYGGSRASTAAHLQTAKDHGFTYAPVDILDAEGEISIPINGGKRLDKALVGSHYANYDYIVSIAHFKGHAMAGFGGSFKNMAIGIASVNGKGAIHRNGNGGGMWSSSGEAFFEKIAEYTKAIADDKKGKIIYINVLNNLSVDCDCDANAAHPQMSDIGILASFDPVAVDKASVDLVYASPDEGRKHLIERIESRKGTYLLNYAEDIGMGTQKYNLVKLDE